MNSIDWNVFLSLLKYIKRVCTEIIFRAFHKAFRISISFGYDGIYFMEFHLFRLF